MQFTAGQVLDVASLNELASFPKYATYFLSEKGYANYIGTLIQDCEALDDPDGIGLTISPGLNMIFPPGEYFIDAQIKVHHSGTYFASLFNETTQEQIGEEVYGYDHEHGMDSILIRRRVTFTVPTEISHRSRNTQFHNYTYSSMQKITKIRNL